MDSHVFSAGDNVEFRRSGAWLPATVIAQRSDDKVVIEYKTLISRNGCDERAVEAVSGADLRPAPPVRREGLQTGEIVEVFQNSCWRTAELVGFSADSRCLVRVDGVEEDLVVDRRDLRACLEWIHGAWRSPACDRQKQRYEPGIEIRMKKLKIKFTIKPLVSKFTPGEKVEVRSDEAGYEGAWYAATIVGSTKSNDFMVEYETIKSDDGTGPLREIVKEKDIRPYPPEISAVKYSRHQAVDVWYNEGWWEGLVSSVIDDSNCVVYFATTNEEMVFESSCLRPHQGWVEGKWVATAPESNVENTNTTKETFDNIFSTGSSVEVRRSAENYEGAWYPATILSSMPRNNFLVELQSIVTGKRNQLRREVVSPWNIRPKAPLAPLVSHYKLLQEVDVWFGGGWWPGMISDVSNEDNYAVDLQYASKKYRCSPSKLRPHHDWIDGTWFVSERTIINMASEANPVMKKTSPAKEFKASFRKGTAVEVKSNEEGFVGSWYSAVIVEPNGEDKYIVEYKTLRTEDDSGFLKELVDAGDIRPSPPHVRVGSFEPLQEVDVWYNEGWWEGVVRQVLGGSRYRVYFSCTDEEMEFHYAYLRLRQEWTEDGSWIAPGKGLQPVAI